MNVKNKKGFTLLEVLLVVTLLGIILAITIPNVAKGSEKANAELCKSSIIVITAAIEQHDLIERDKLQEEGFIQELVTKEYLKHELECPSGGTYEYSDGNVTCDKHGSQSE